MLVGFNYPWPANRYITIGPNLSPRGKPQPWTQDTKMANNFKMLKDARITVVRMWLMGDGRNYDGRVQFGFANDQGLFWEFEPPDQVDKSFLDDFSTLLNICKDAGIQLIPVLVDFAFFNEPKPDNRYGTTTVAAPLPLGFQPTTGDFSRGRRSIASNASYRKRFIEGTLEPLLKVAAAKKEVIYAFDVFNEPYWCIAPITGSLFGKRMENDDIIAFLLDCTASVKKFGLKSTIGHRYLSDIYRTFDKVKVDLPQHHYYAHPKFMDDLMNPKTYPKPAKILGEFGSVTPKEFEVMKRLAQKERNTDRKAAFEDIVNGWEIQVSTWPDLYGLERIDPENMLEKRLNYAEACGYELAMMWCSSQAMPPQDTIDDLKLDEIKLKSVRQFTAR